MLFWRSGVETNDAFAYQRPSGHANTFSGGSSIGASAGSGLANNPIFQKAAMNAAKDPAVQSTAWNVAKDPAVQKGIYGAVGSSGGSGAAFAGGLASNPAFQRAAANAASDPAVQKAARNAAKDPGLQKAAIGSAFGVTGNVGLGPKEKVVVATADFDAAEEGDLALRLGDLITVLEDIDENWYRGENKMGTRGIFPKNHVEMR
ncbi:hypothetical protein BC830DRAFT_1136752 [Chytriomyces sp. MP71]|nr:hypothetical protein BC830DRAFT_1136752 [Chytriomyces sp. MP71]